MDYFCGGHQSETKWPSVPWTLLLVEFLSVRAWRENEHKRRKKCSGAVVEEWCLRWMAHHEKKNRKWLLQLWVYSIYFVTGNWNVDDTQHRLVQAAKVIKYSCAQRVTDVDDGGDLVAQKRSSTSSGGWWSWTATRKVQSLKWNNCFEPLRNCLSSLLTSLALSCISTVQSPNIIRIAWTFLYGNCTESLSIFNPLRRSRLSAEELLRSAFR